jgi:hypothetical protein
MIDTEERIERPSDRLGRTIKPLRPQEPEVPPRARRPLREDVGAAWPIFRALLAMLLVLLVLNTQALLTTVERRPDGPIRTIFLGVSRGLNTAAGRFGLERPMAWLDYAQADRDNTPTFAGIPGVASSTPTPSPSETPAPAETPPAAQPTAPAEGPAPAAVATPAAPAAQNTPVPPTAAPTVPPQRAVTTAAPLRVYVAGDSFVDSIAEVLAETSTNKGQLAVLADGHANSGLSEPSYTNWPVRLRQALANQPAPEAVVFMAGANDGVAIRTTGGTLEYGTAAWNTEYSRRAGEIMDIVGQSGARFYYIGQPIMRESKQNRIANDINIAIVKAAASRPWVSYIDSWALLTDRDGNYATYLENTTGETIKARADDGIHLTPTSTVWVANAAYAAIRKEWKLPQ